MSGSVVARDHDVMTQMRIARTTRRDGSDWATGMAANVPRNARRAPFGLQGLSLQSAAVHGESCRDEAMAGLVRQRLNHDGKDESTNQRGGSSPKRIEENLGHDINAMVDAL
jgi:hypothetical protein